MSRTQCGGRIAALCLAVDLQPIAGVCDQTFWVGLFYRIRHTTATGSIASKKSGAAWAADTLNRGWRGLIERSVAARSHREELRISRADPAEVAARREFIAYVVGRLEGAAGPIR